MSPFHDTLTSDKTVEFSSTTLHLFTSKSGREVDPPIRKLNLNVNFILLSLISDALKLIVTLSFYGLCM